MDGTWVIHPQQAEIATSASRRRRADRRSEALVEDYHKHGGGSIADPETGEFYDEATIKGAADGPREGGAGRQARQAWLTAQAKKSKDVTGYDILEVMGRVA